MPRSKPDQMTRARLQQGLTLTLFLVSLAINLALSALDPSWFAIPAMLAGWYFADLLSGLIHMYMDYRPTTPGKRLADLFF